MKKLPRPSFRLAILTITLLLSVSCTKKAREQKAFEAGEAASKAGEYDKAKIDYMKAIRFNPSNAVAFARLGELWMDDGVPLRAGAFLKRAEELAPHDLENRLRLGRVYLMVGQAAEAQKEALTVLQEAPANAEALLLLTQMARSSADTARATAAVEKFPNKQGAPYLIATANVALRKRDISAAQKAIERALAADPKSVEAHQMMAVISLIQKNPKAAGDQFKAAADLAPLRSNAQMTYAEYLAQSGNKKEATQFLNRLTAKAPDFLPAWIALARLAIADKGFDNALAYLENVLSRDPANIDGRLLQSDIYLATRKSDKAVAELEKLDKAYPGLPQVKYRLAQADLQQNKVLDAEKALDQAIAANPGYADAVLLRAQLSLKTGHAEDAVKALEQLLKNQPALASAEVLLADAYRAAGRLDDAAAIFQKQIQARPKEAQPYFFLGIIQQQQKKNAEARKSFEEVLELSPDNLYAISQLLDLDLGEKNFASATARAQSEIQKHPKVAASYLLLGRVQMAQSQWKEAEATLKKALEIDPNAGAAYELLVRTYLATKRLPEAASELETVLAKAPNNQSALMTLASIREKQSMFPKAREAYEKLLSLNPNFVPALNNLAYLYAERFGQPDKAYELAQKARSLEPGNAAIADTLGWASFKRGDYPQALALLQESAGKAQDNPEIQFHLGMAFYMMGQAGPARDAFHKAVAASNDFPSKSEAESRLAILGDGGSASTEADVAKLEQLLQKQPNDVMARLRLAKAYEKKGEWPKAAQSYEAVMHLNPKLPSPPLKLAQLYSGPIPNKEKALSFGKLARSLAPNDAKTTAVLGKIAFQNGDYAWAYNLLLESSRSLSSDPAVLHDFAWAAYSLGKVTDAREAMQRCLAASPDSAIAADAKTFLAFTAIETGAEDRNDARSPIEAKLKEDGRYVPALMAAATLDARKGDKAKAAEEYRLALAQFPSFAPAQKQLASLLADDPTHVAEAFDLASKARQALPDDRDLQALLGRLNFEKKDYSRAIQLLQESSRKQPDPVGLYYLGMSQFQVGQKTAARDALSQAIKLGLKEPFATTAKKALTSAGR